MKKNTTASLYTALFAVIFVCINVTFAQTNPTAQTLATSQNFGTTTFATMPTGFAVWTVNSSPIGSQTNAQNSTTNGDATITAATASQSTGGAYGYATSSNGRVYFQTSSNSTNGTNQLVCAINTTGWTSVLINYDIEAIAMNPRTIGAVLQYRIGTSGSWTTISGTTYSHTSVDRSNGAVDNFTNIALPTGANNNAIVQLRWAIWRGSETGNSSGIAIDNISITATSSQTAYYFRSKQSGNFNDVNSWEASADKSNWNNATVTPTSTANTITILNGHHITLTASETIDQTTIDAGGILTYATGSTSIPTISNGTGTDLIINGTFEDIGDNPIVWSSGAKWSIGNNATLLRTRSTSANNWRDNYDGGISTIPATATWILRKTSSDNPSLSSTGNMYYPNLIIENTTGSTWSTSTTPGFTGTSSAPIIKGDFNIGGNASGNVSFINDNNATTTVLVSGNLTIKAGTTLRNYGTGLEVQGNITLNGTIDNGTANSKFVFSGSNNQTVTGVFTFKNLELNKTTNTATVTLNSPATVTGVFTFTKGKLITTATNLLNFNDGSSATGASNDSYIDGPCKKVGNSAFTYPTGKNGNYQPIGITAPTASTDAFTAEYFATGQTLGSALESTITNLSTCEYWQLNRTTGTSIVAITLGWNINSCNATQPENMRVTEWNGSLWTDMGNTAYTGNLTTGAVQNSVAISSYGTFTLSNHNQNCANATAISEALSPINISMVSNNMWFVFTATSSNMGIIFSDNEPTAASIYSGDCNSLNLITSQNQSALDSGQLQIFATNLIVGNLYYVKVDGSSVLNFELRVFKKVNSLCAAGNACEQVINGGFENGIFGTSASYDSQFWHGDVSCWDGAFGSPQRVDGTVTSNTAAHTGTYFAAMWNYNALPPHGEGIITSVNVISGHSYTLTYWQKKLTYAGNVNLNKIFAILANSSSSGLPNGIAATGADVPVIPHQEIDGPATGNINFSSTSWVQRIQTFTADSDYDQLVIYPEQISGNACWLGIDDVSLVSSATVTANSATICVGEQATLEVSGASISSTCVWVPSSGLSATSGLSINASPSSTTTYTAMVTDVNGCSFTTTSTVTVLLLQTVSAGTDADICSGDTYILYGGAMGGAASSVNWTTSGSGSFNNPNITQPIYYPSTADITAGSVHLTITGNSAGTCPATDDMVLHIINGAPSVSISETSGGIHICQGESVTFTATPTNGGTTPHYQWQVNGVNAGINSTTFTTSTLTDGQIVTCQLTSYLCASPLTANSNPITIHVGNTCTSQGGTEITATTLETGYDIFGQPYNNPFVVDWNSDAGYYVSGNIILASGTVLNITNTGVRFAPGTSITIRDGATLNINGSWLHACNNCSGMWDGIHFDLDGVNLSVSGALTIDGSIIEDATTAVITDADKFSAQINYTINNSIFNKNTVGVNLQHDFTLINHTSNQSPILGTVNRSIFTCRKMPIYNASDVANIATIINDAQTNFEANTSLASIYPITNTIANVRSNAGVRLTNLTAINDVQIGQAQALDPIDPRNIFDNLDFGVYMNNADCAIKNNRFQNLINTGGESRDVPPVLLPNTGFGVFGTSTGTGLRKVNIGNGDYDNANTFSECWRGINISNYKEVNILKNTFKINATPGNPYSGPFPSDPFLVADMAIMLSDISTTAEIKDNEIHNWITGIWLRSTASVGLFPNNAYIYENQIRAVGNASNYCMQAILLTGVEGLTNIQNFHIHDNILENIDNGIKATNIAAVDYPQNGGFPYERHRLSIYNHSTNPIIIRYRASGSFSGIKLEGCTGYEVINNAIESTSKENLNITGIYVQSSAGGAVQCNTINNVGRCLAFEGLCYSPTGTGTGSGFNYHPDNYGVLNNTMETAKIGLMLRQLAGSNVDGEIGTQGDASTLASGNSWNGNPSDFTNGQTFTDHTSNANANSILYCENTTTTLPSNNISNPSGVGFEYNTLGGGLVIANGTPLDCAAITLPQGKSMNNGNKSPITDATYTGKLKLMLQNDTAIDGLFSAKQWTTQNFVYNQVHINSSLQQDSVLNAFYIANQTTAYGLFLSVNDSIKSKNYVAATALNNSTNPANIYESNQYNFNRIYLTNLDSIALYTSADSAALYQIAIQCPGYGGHAVYQCRNLLMFIENKVLNFVDTCNLVQENEQRKMIKYTTPIAKPMRLYPNPNNGSMTLEYNLDEDGVMQIWDIAGKLIATYKLNSKVNALKINENLLTNGIYYYGILVNNRKLFTDKLVIIK